VVSESHAEAISEWGAEVISESGADAKSEPGAELISESGAEVRRNPQEFGGRAQGSWIPHARPAPLPRRVV